MNKSTIALIIIGVVLCAFLVYAAETKVFTNQNMMGNNIVNTTAYNLTSTGTITSNATCKVLIKGATSVICVE